MSRFWALGAAAALATLAAGWLGGGTAYGEAPCRATLPDPARHH